MRTTIMLHPLRQRIVMQGGNELRQILGNILLPAGGGAWMELVIEETDAERLRIAQCAATPAMAEALGAVRDAVLRMGPVRLSVEFCP